MLYRVVKEFFIDFEGMDVPEGYTEYTLKVDEKYFVEMDGPGGGWPMVYIPELNDWFDIALTTGTSGTLMGDDDEVYMVHVPKSDWSSEESIKSQLKTKVYEALENVATEYCEIQDEFHKEAMKEAIEWFMVHYYNL